MAFGCNKVTLRLAFDNWKASKAPNILRRDEKKRWKKREGVGKIWALFHDFSVTCVWKKKKKLKYVHTYLKSGVFYNCILAAIFVFGLSPVVQEMAIVESFSSIILVWSVRPSESAQSECYCVLCVSSL